MNGNDAETGLSLCAGVGGLELGLAIAVPGYRTLCYVEREPYPVRVLRARIRDGWLHDGEIWHELGSFASHPDGAEKWRGRVGILSAGFPCQPWSLAGKRGGTSDERWLWPLIAETIRKVGPEWVFLENVPGIRLRTKVSFPLEDAAGNPVFNEVGKRVFADAGTLPSGLALVFGDLAALGYDAVWDLFSAGEVGAPHRRERVFLLAHKQGDGRAARGTEPDGGRASGEGEGMGHPAGPRCDDGGPEEGGEVRDLGGGSEPHGRGGEVAHAGRDSPAHKQAGAGTPSEHPARGRGGGVAHPEDPHGRAEPQGAGGDGAGPPGGRAGLADGGGGNVGQPEGSRLEGGDGGEQGSDELLPWPPGPADSDAWVGLLARFPDLAPALPKSAFRRSTHGPAARVDRLAALGNAVVPVQACLAFLRLRARLESMMGEAGR